MKRTLSVLAALALTAIVLLTSVCCAQTSTPDTTTTKAPSGGNSTDVSAEESTLSAEELGFRSELSDLDFGGTEVTFLVSGKPHSADEFDSFEASGDIVDNAVFRRNSMVEQSLNIKMKVDVGESDSDSYPGKIIKSHIEAGTHTYDIITLPGYVQTRFAVDGCFYNLIGVENLDLDKLYWTQGFNEIMSNGIQQYTASGAYSLSLIRNMYITIYNKEIFDTRKLPDLYELVMKNEWTVDRQIEMIKDTWDDLNGNGERDENDFYGFVSGTYTSVDPYWVSFNLQLLHVDKTSHEYTIEVNNDKMVDVLQKIIDLIMYNDDAFNVGGTSTTDASRMTNIIDKFAAQRCAMATTTVYHIENSLTNAGFDHDYGIVPMPKYNQDQADYYTHTQDQLSLMAIVSSVDKDKLPMMGAVMDQIAYYSYREVFPAYYETALSYRYLQNAQSKVMLDMIYKSLKIEGCFIFHDSFQILGQLRKMVSGQSRQANASSIVSETRSWNNKVKDLNRQLAAQLK